MGVEGLFGFLKHQKIEGAIVDHSIDEILQQIRSYRKAHNASPKIFFNLRAFNNYNEQTIKDTMFGCRFNVIKRDFEGLLSSLKNAGAELIFVSRKDFLDELEDVYADWLDHDYEKGLEYVKILESVKSFRELNATFGRQKTYPWQETAVHVLVQSAQKFGTFKGINCFSNSPTSQIQLANDENVFAVCGLNTSYLFHDGEWKILFPAKNFKSRSKEMIMKEFDREKIMGHFGLNRDQFQVFGVLGGKLTTSLEHKQTLKNFFKKDKFINFHQIAEFVLKNAPVQKFPLQRDTIDRILLEIFGEADDELRQDFNNAMSFSPPPKLYPDRVFPFDDKKTELLLQQNPFSSFAESILYDVRLVIESPFLDVKATDMKTLEELTKDWLERFGGILLKDLDVNRSFSIVYRMRSGKLEKYHATPQIPFGIPDWPQLIANEVTMDEKIQTLEFLLGDTISIEDLKTIPLQFMMHVIITMHLLKNDSMTMKEAIAMTKAVSSKNASIAYPQHVSARAFRVSSLYEKMYSVLLMCLSPLGLSDFVGELTLDNVLFQNILNETESTAETKDAFKIIMNILR